MFNYIKRIAKHFYTYKCVFCKTDITKASPICFTCNKDIGTINQSSICRKCGRYCLAPICTFCLHSPPLFESARAYCTYGSVSSLIIKHFKYYNNTLCKKFITHKMSQIFAIHYSNTHIDIITPIPMNCIKEWWKGYNHSLKLSQELSKIHNIPIIHNLLKKKFTFKRQAVLNKFERMQNIANTMVFNKKYNITNKTILLIDDTITTGATVTECCRSLLSNGAKNVFVLTFAKSIADEAITD